MHLEVQEAVGAEGQNVIALISSRVDASHDSEPRRGEGGSLGGERMKKRC